MKSGGPVYGLGIDSGSSFCKGALLVSGGEGRGLRIEALASRPSGWDVAATGARVLEALRKAAGAADLNGARLPVAATGYGREQIPCCSDALSEISAHAAGADFLCPGVRTVVDIGGQDCKVIVVEGGKARDFQMNDKCAAGSGRFLELVFSRLDADPAVMEALLTEGRSVSIDSTCAVFAESELVGLLAQGASRPEIMGGAVAALASRVASLAARLSVSEPAVLSGGLAESPGLARALSSALGVTVRPLRRGTYSGAIGAALRAAQSDGPPAAANE
ncbi:MAG: acyl-CoA dehydratase activase [Spirochaetaceae bacterium]|jgi:predicted CoA-substrate-specific enzyme activase|nr:acyl-CoA dehydratase activase [Spirochaetaceae bacterium]